MSINFLVIWSKGFDYTKKGLLFGIENIRLTVIFNKTIKSELEVIYIYLFEGNYTEVNLKCRFK